MAVIKTGDNLVNKKGLRYEVIETDGSIMATVMFDDGYIGTFKACHAANGSIKNPNNPEVLGVGFIGVGKHRSKINGKVSANYYHWRAMLQRCYSDEYKEKQPITG